MWTFEWNKSDLDFMIKQNLEEIYESWDLRKLPFTASLVLKILSSTQLSKNDINFLDNIESWSHPKDRPLVWKVKSLIDNIINNWLYNDYKTNEWKN